MKHKIADLTGTLLDAAVALADGRLVVKDEPGWDAGEYQKYREDIDGKHIVRWYGESGELGGWEALESQGSPSTDWGIGGPIIEREHIELHCLRRGGLAYIGFWLARVPGGISPLVEGDTPLVAAMRAHVAAKLGEEVDLP